MPLNVPALRLNNQRITRPLRGRVDELVAWLGGVQAQEYPFAKWGLALRMAARPSGGALEEAFAAGRILRTHVLRPTWHFVPASDIRWMLALTGPRILRTLASYMRRQGPDNPTLVRASAVIERALSGAGYLTRRELSVLLSRSGIHLTPLQLGFVVMNAELHGLVCSGPRRERQLTYALLADRAPIQRQLSGDEALAELVRRYFQSHGPATIRDFAWWSGLTMSDARRGLEMTAMRSAEQDGCKYWFANTARAAAPSRRAHLLPIYDEYLVAYRDRVAVPHGPSTIRAGSRTVAFRHALVIDGQVAGTWHVSENTPVSIEVTPLRTLDRSERRAVEAAVEGCRGFLTG
jgi:hypothetical protein